MRSSITNEKNSANDRIKALMARSAAYGRNEQFDRAIADYNAALELDPLQADALNNRGEAWRRKGDRLYALADFGAAIRLSSQHPSARGNYKSLAQELERLGAAMAVNNKPSFNCATARRAVEKVICENANLANLDREISAMNTQVVRDAASDSPRAGRALQKQQGEFIAKRNARFGRADYDLAKAMKQRLEMLVGIDGY